MNRPQPFGQRPHCPDCDSPELHNRRDFLASAGAALAAGAAVAGGLGPNWAVAKDTAATSTAGKTPETLVKVLYDTLTEAQKKAMCFDWDYVEAKAPPERKGPGGQKARGLLRTFISNNWMITPQALIDHKQKFYTDEQRDIVRKIFEGIIQPEWHAKIDKQLEDDAGGFGHEQSIAIFGKPGDGKFEFVMTGRHHQALPHSAAARR